MPDKLKWRTDKERPLVPESVSTVEEAKERTRQLLRKYQHRVEIEIWNEDETWQVVTAAGISEWCELPEQ